MQVNGVRSEKLSLVLWSERPHEPLACGPSASINRPAGSVDVVALWPATDVCQPSNRSELCQGKAGHDSDCFSFSPPEWKKGTRVKDAGRYFGSDDFIRARRGKCAQSDDGQKGQQLDTTVLCLWVTHFMMMMMIFFSKYTKMSFCVSL